MSDRLGDLFRTATAVLPAARGPADLFDRAQRARRRRSVGAGITVVVLLVMATAGWTAAWRSAPYQPAEGRTTGLPSRLRIPPLWTATAGQSPPGRAAVIFGGAAATDDWNEGRFGVVAADADRYRVFDEVPYTPPGFEALLSPDGSLVARPGGVWDLTDGTRRASSGAPLAFSPDGRYLVTAADAEFLSGDRYVTPHVEVRDLTGVTEPVRVPVGTAWVTPGWSAAVSADGGQLALQVRDDIWLVGLHTGATRPPRRISLAGGRLAGPAAWSPRGGTVSVVRRGQCTGCWQLERRDVTSGRLDATRYPAVTSAGYLRVIGWQDGVTAVALVGTGSGDGRRLDPTDSAWGPYLDDTVERVRLVLLRPGAAEPEVVWQTPTGVSEADVAAEVATAAVVRGPGTASYGPPHPMVLAAGGCLAAVAAAVIWSSIVVRRRWSRRRASR